MYPILYGIIIVISIASLIGTLYVGKVVNKTSDKYAKEGDKGESNLTSQTNVKHNSSIQMLSIIYIIFFILTIIFIAFLLIL
ncbi:hypothetical protein GLW08_12400 [Pontibacillus yanchengensis]|uniref:Uncharacterized protein n=2 Tax=Pontibacillus yanchengensis TaxID=462910 RepID=A0A6I4ZTQ7_9BACI|nr:hypothetical protein [Pontibacillus yanchengensis]MYL33625.1 hypothetical protein [Pontibacillus yanchengensis]MYL54139.1 hypothetical protein [Pontibacillus yanchengensis]